MPASLANLAVFAQQMHGMRTLVETIQRRIRTILVQYSGKGIFLVQSSP
jgi:hypothetical protein